MAQAQYVLYPSFPGAAAAGSTLVPVVQAVQPQNIIFEEQKPDVRYQDLLTTYGSYTHVAETIYYARQYQMLYGRYPQPATILMMLREDGTLDFFGGHVEKSDASLLDGLNRELKEEINIKQNHEVCSNDHVISEVDHSSRRVYHLFIHELSPEDISQIEKRATGAIHWGVETFGLVRVPLYTLDDGFGGLPAFLSNMFYVGSRRNLINMIRQRQLIPSVQLDAAVHASDMYIRNRQI